MSFFGTIPYEATQPLINGESACDGGVLKLCLAGDKEFREACRENGQGSKCTADVARQLQRFFDEELQMAQHQYLDRTNFRKYIDIETPVTRRADLTVSVKEWSGQKKKEDTVQKRLQFGAGSAVVNSKYYVSVTTDNDAEELRGFYDYLQSENFIIENGIHKKNLSSPAEAFQCAADAVMRLKESSIRPRELSHIITSGSEEQTEKCRTLVALLMGWAQF